MIIPTVEGRISSAFEKNIYHNNDDNEEVKRVVFPILALKKRRDKYYK